MTLKEFLNVYGSDCLVETTVICQREGTLLSISDDLDNLLSRRVIQIFASSRRVEIFLEVKNGKD